MMMIGFDDYEVCGGRGGCCSNGNDDDYLFGTQRQVAFKC